MHYAGCINSIISSSTSPPYRLYSNAKPSAMCSIKWFTEKAIKLQKCSRKYLRWSVPAGSDLGKSLTFEFAPCVYDFLRYGQRQEISPIYLVVVPLIAR